MNIHDLHKPSIERQEQLQTAWDKFKAANDKRLKDLLESDTKPTSSAMTIDLPEHNLT